MTAWAIFDTGTGQIFEERQVTVEPSGLPAGRACLLVIDGLDLRSFYVDESPEGVYVLVAIPEQPSHFCAWDWSTKAWAFDLAAAKAGAWLHIKALRTAAITAPLVTEHGTFQCDPISRTNIVNAALRAQQREARGEVSDAGFTLADNTRPTFTVEQLTDVAMALGDREDQAYATAQALREQIEAATTQAELDAIVWPE